MKDHNERQKDAHVSAKAYAQRVSDSGFENFNLEYALRNAYQNGWLHANAECEKEIQFLRTILLKSMTSDYLEKIIKLLEHESEESQELSRLQKQIRDIENRISGINNRSSRRNGKIKSMTEAHKALLAHRIIHESNA